VKEGAGNRATKKVAESHRFQRLGRKKILRVRERLFPSQKRRVGKCLGGAGEKNAVLRCFSSRPGKEKKGGRNYAVTERIRSDQQPVVPGGVIKKEGRRRVFGGWVGFFFFFFGFLSSYSKERLR